MPECPNCHKYYFGTPEQCPNCHKMLPVYVKASTTVQSSSNNIGNTVQTLAMIDLVINVIATFVCAFVFGKDFSSYRPEFSFGNFLLILLVGLVISAVLFILLYAFGCMVESTIISATNSAQSLRCLISIEQAQEKALTTKQEKA